MSAVFFTLVLASVVSEGPASQPGSRPDENSIPAQVSNRAPCAPHVLQRVLSDLDAHPALRSEEEKARQLEGMGRAEAAAPDPSLFLEVRGMPLTEPWNMGRTPMGGVQLGVQAKVPWMPRLWANEEARTFEARATRSAAGEARLYLLEKSLAVLVEDEVLEGRQRILADTEQLLTSLSGVARANALVGAGGQTDAVLLEARAAQARAQIDALSEERRALGARWRSVHGEDREALRCSLLDTALVDEALNEDAQLETRPRLLALEDRARAARARKRAAWHAWVPEPTFKGGYVWRPDYGSFDGMDFVGGMVSIPLPMLPARRLGPLAAARAAEQKATADREAFLRENRGAIEEIRARLDAETRRMKELEESARPVAEAASQVAQASYRSGHGRVAAVIEAERLVLEIDLALLEARARQARLRLALWRLLGAPLSSSPPPAESPSTP